MKNQKKIWIAFVLNLFFAVFEAVGGLLTGSIAILSDALHDAGDAASIGISYALEKKSLGKPNGIYTYGYVRFSLLGSLITHTVLLVGSLAVIINAVYRMLYPTEINYNGMIVFAVVGVVVNLSAALVTHDGSSFNLKAVNLHLLEDVLGWVVVLLGAVVMRFTGLVILDPLMSLAVSLLIGWMALRGLRDTLEVFLEKSPQGISVSELEKVLTQLNGVEDVHHLHVWSLDGHIHCATVHIVTTNPPCEAKAQVRKILVDAGISHVTIELESPDEPCAALGCHIQPPSGECHHQHHHHH